MPGFRPVKRVEAAKIVKSSHAVFSGKHPEWNGAGGFKPGNQYGKKTESFQLNQNSGKSQGTLFGRKPEPEIDPVFHPGKLGKMEIDPSMTNKELDNFRKVHPKSRIVDIPITEPMKEKALEHLNMWKRLHPGEVAKVKSILGADKLPPPIIRDYGGGEVGFPDGFHRVASYVLAGRKTIRGHFIGPDGKPKS